MQGRGPRGTHWCLRRREEEEEEEEEEEDNWRIINLLRVAGLQEDGPG